jgi:predicted enzyme related to lactoylglutathione lyase
VTATPVEKTYIMVMVADMSRALRFYTEAFQVTVVINSPYWSEFVVAGTNIALHSGGSGDQTQTGLGFEVKDLDAALLRAVEVGGRITSTARERAQERIRVAEIADTEGNVITLAQLIN